MHKSKALYLCLFLILAFTADVGAQSVGSFLKGIRKGSDNIQIEEKRELEYSKWRKTRANPSVISFLDYSGSNLDNILGTFLEYDYIPIIYLDAPAKSVISNSDKKTDYFSVKEYTQQVALEEKLLAEEDTESPDNEILIADDGTFSPIPPQYKIWSSVAVDPYGVDMSQTNDTLKIDVSSYQTPGYKHITSVFGWRRNRMHYGIDLKVFTGDTIRSAFDNGVVRIKRFNRKGYGNYVVVRHSNGLETLYGHMSKSLVNEGDTLRVGDVIGLGGSTGRSSGSHLHFEIRYLGKAINPQSVIDFENNRLLRNTLVLTKKDFTYGRGKGKGSKGKSSTTSKGKEPTTIVVRKGDTLGAIARRYGTTVARIKQLNGLKSNNINAGKRLRVR